MLVEFGKASLLAKVRQLPDKVKLVLGKVRTDGLAGAPGFTWESRSAIDLQQSYASLQPGVSGERIKDQ